MQSLSKDPTYDNWKTCICFTEIQIKTIERQNVLFFKYAFYDYNYEL